MSAKNVIKKIPVLRLLAKLFYDWKQESSLDKRIKKFINRKHLSFTEKAPDKYAVGYEPTIRCNLKCKMCYQGETRVLRGDELSTGQILEIYGKLQGRVSEIKLVGGEPMVRQDIFELIAFWDQAGVRVILQ